MDKIQELDRFLDADTDSNYWSDYGVLRASDLLKTIAPTDLEHLAENWPSRPSKWQIRFADVLGDGDPVQAIPILVDMILKGDDLLAVTACDALRTHLDNGGTPVEASASLMARVEQLHSSRQGLIQESLALLLDRLKNQ